MSNVHIVCLCFVLCTLQTWDVELERSAESWAETCLWEHGPASLLPSIGQNLGAHWGRQWKTQPFVSGNTNVMNEMFINLPLQISQSLLPESKRANRKTKETQYPTRIVTDFLAYFCIICICKICSLHRRNRLSIFANLNWFQIFLNFSCFLWFFSSNRYRPPTFHVQAWYDEVRDFSYPYEHECNPYCPFRCSGPVCTHYTQVCFV